MRPTLAIYLSLLLLAGCPVSATGVLRAGSHPIHSSADSLRSLFGMHVHVLDNFYSVDRLCKWFFSACALLSASHPETKSSLPPAPTRARTARSNRFEKRLQRQDLIIPSIPGMAALLSIALARGHNKQCFVHWMGLERLGTVRRRRFPRSSLVKLAHGMEHRRTHILRRKLSSSTQTYLPVTTLGFCVQTKLPFLSRSGGASRGPLA